MLTQEAVREMSQQAQPKGTVLVVEDDETVRSGLYWALTSDYQVLQASSREEACQLINNEEIEVVVSDLHLPPNVQDIAEGLALIDVARAQAPPLQVVVITGSDSKRAALEAVRRGAYGFFRSHSTRRSCCISSTRPRACGNSKWRTAGCATSFRARPASRI
jgi:DNA-binding NtrC family response regulator